MTAPTRQERMERAYCTSTARRIRAERDQTWAVKNRRRVYPF